MLDAYWLFGEPNADIARNPARLDEYISLFKHACVTQRKVNLSDLMVAGAPNFRNAYHLDPEFRKLVQSDIVNISYLHAEEDGSGATMDLIGVKDFHIRKDLFYPEERDYFRGESSDAFLRALQAKDSSTLIVRDGRGRDPRFTQRVLSALGCDYLQRHFGADQRLFAECTRELHGELAAAGEPLGAIWFEEGRRADGKYRWRRPTVLDRMFQRMDHLSPERRREIGQIAWRFYRTHLFRAESDLIETDPVVPPETDFYVEVMYGERPETFFVPPAEDGKFYVYRISTDLDDATLYRHLDLKTILDVRKLGAAYFDLASKREPQPELATEDRLRRDAVRAAEVGAALKEYKHAAVALLAERFPTLRQLRWDRELILRVATVIDYAALDTKGRPRPTVSALVSSAMAKAGSAMPFDTLLELNMEARHLARYLVNFATPMLYIADAEVANAAESLANRMRREALLGDEPRTKIDARLIAEKAPGSTDSTILYGPVGRST
jgi:hypothetical protein